jgi:hypothetical protein
MKPEAASSKTASKECSFVASFLPLEPIFFGDFGRTSAR